MTNPTEIAEKLPAVQGRVDGEHAVHRLEYDAPGEAWQIVRNNYGLCIPADFAECVIRDACVQALERTRLYEHQTVKREYAILEADALALMKLVIELCEARVVVEPQSNPQQRREGE